MPRPSIHPGEILGDELVELGVSPTELARRRLVYFTKCFETGASRRQRFSDCLRIFLDHQQIGPHDQIRTRAFLFEIAQPPEIEAIIQSNRLLS